MACDQFMLKCLRQIAWISTQSEFYIRAKHIASKNNILPDALSRWYINKEARKIVKDNIDNTWKK